MLENVFSLLQVKSIVFIFKHVNTSHAFCNWDYLPLPFYHPLLQRGCMLVKVNIQINKIFTTFFFFLILAEITQNVYNVDFYCNSICYHIWNVTKFS